MDATARAVRDQKVLWLHMSGASYRKIAAAVGLKSQSSIHRIIHRQLADDGGRRALLTSQARAVFIERTEALLRAHWPAAMAGDYQAALVVDRVLGRQARLYGLDRPVLQVRRQPQPDDDEDDDDD